MNREYMKVTPEIVMVTNEYGNLEERKIEYNDLDKAFVLENNLEFVNKIIRDLENYISNNHPFDKNNYFYNVEIPLFGTFLAGVAGALYNHDTLFLSAICLGGVACALSGLYTGICNISYLKDEKHKKEAYQLVLEKAYTIRETIIEELKGLKNNIDFNDKGLFQSITLLEDARFIGLTEDALNEEYLNNVESKRLRRQLPIK